MLAFLFVVTFSLVKADTQFTVYMYCYHVQGSGSSSLYSNNLSVLTKDQKKLKMDELAKGRMYVSPCREVTFSDKQNRDSVNETFLWRAAENSYVDFMARKYAVIVSPEHDSTSGPCRTFDDNTSCNEDRFDKLDTVGLKYSVVNTPLIGDDSGIVME